MKYLLLFSTLISCFSSLIAQNMPTLSASDSTILALKPLGILLKSSFDSNAEWDNYNKNLSISLQKNGFFFHRFIPNPNKPLDFSLTLGPKASRIQIKIDKNPIINNNSITIPFTHFDSLISAFKIRFDLFGSPRDSFYFDNWKASKDILYTNFRFLSAKKHWISHLKIKSANENLEHNFPKNIFGFLEKKFKRKPFDQKTLLDIQNRFDQLTFAQTTEKPQYILSKDSCLIFVPLTTKNKHSIDGFVGFGPNDNNQLELNGYFDLKLENIIHKGESLRIFWRKEQKAQSTFEADLTLPFLFKSPFLLQSKFSVFSRDTIFQTSHLDLALGYQSDFGAKWFLHYISSKSETNDSSATMDSFVLNQIAFSVVDSKKHPLEIMENHHSFSVLLGYGKRKIILSDKNNIQFRTDVSAEKLWKLGRRFFVWSNLQFHQIWSKDWLENESLRVGGSNSIRGFTDNRFLANGFFSLQNEFRFLLDNRTYIHSIFDFGHLQNRLAQIRSTTIFGYGIGLKTILKNGTFQLGIARGQTPTDSNSILITSYQLNL